jgi:hypothetical protein
MIGCLRFPILRNGVQSDSLHSNTNSTIPPPHLLKSHTGPEKDTLDAFYDAWAWYIKNNFPFMYFKKMFSQVSLLILTKYFQNIIIMFCLEL